MNKIDQLGLKKLGVVLPATGIKSPAALAAAAKLPEVDDVMNKLTRVNMLELRNKTDEFSIDLNKLLESMIYDLKGNLDSWINKGSDSSPSDAELGMLAIRCKQGVFFKPRQQKADAAAAADPNAPPINPNAPIEPKQVPKVQNFPVRKINATDMTSILLMRLVRL